MIGETVAHYNVLEEVGRGGMGVVYKAQDTRLKRLVALKFLKPHALANQEDRARFLIEAQAAAALDHPNLCTIYEINEVDGHIYIAMAFIDGRNLKSALQVEKLEFGRALEIVSQIAQGLQEAHRKGIFHRDIKPSNILITRDGQAKIVDFGLARLHDSSQITRTGAVLGTPAYMSPEQIDGSEVDQRSDIYSLGVVLYEMLSGRLPFQGENQLTIMYAILNKSPDPIVKSNSGIPDGLHLILEKTLAKDRAQRFQHTAEFLAALDALGDRPKNKQHLLKVPRRPRVSQLKLAISSLLFLLMLAASFFGLGYWRTDSSPPLDRNSLAVMYFDNLSNSDDIDWYRRGAADLLIEHLAHIRTLKVLSSENLFYALEKVDAIDTTQVGLESAVEISKRARAGTLVLGSFIKIAERVRFQIKLCEVESKQVFAVESVDMTDESEFFDCMRKLGERIKTHLEIMEMQDEDEIVKEDIRTRSVDAYKNFTIGNTIFMKLDQSRAIPFLQSAIANDSSFTAAYELLVAACINTGRYDLATQTLRAGAEHLKSGSLKDRLVYDFLEGAINYNFEQEREALTKLLQIEPDNRGFLYSLGLNYNRTHQPEKAIAPLQKLADMRWKLPFVYYQLGWACHRAGRHQEEIAAYETGIEIFPGYSVLYAAIAREYFGKGEIKKERQVFDRMMQLADEGTLRKRSCFANLIFEYIDNDYNERAADFYRQLRTVDSTVTGMHCYFGRIYIGIERWDRALDEYQKCFDAGEGDARAHYYLGFALQRLERIDEAISSYNRFLSLQDSGKLAHEARVRLNALQARK